MVGYYLSQAIKSVLYDNGLVNRLNPESVQMEKAVQTIKSKFSCFEIRHAESFLENLDESEFDEFCIGAWSRCTLTDGESYADKILTEVLEVSCVN